ncbi:MAG: hypothetical protein ACC646_11570, partial [Paracoccaceae bacterium]
LVPELPDFAYSPVWVLTHADLKRVPRIRAFVHHAATRLRALRPLFMGRGRTSEPSDGLERQRR